MDRNSLIAVCFSCVAGAGVILGLGGMIYDSTSQNKANLVEMVKAGASPIAAHCAVYGSTSGSGNIKPECVASVFMNHQESSK